MKMARVLLRLVAIMIAIAGAIDPAIAWHARVKPDVSLIATGPLPDPSLVDRVARALEPIATVVRGPSIGAAATVSVGDQLPQPGALDTRAAFAVLPTAHVPFVTIESIRAPERANLDARTPVTAAIRARASKGRAIVVRLDVDGIAVDEATRTPSADDETIVIEFGLVTTRPGPVMATVVAHADGSATDAQADVALRVATDRHPVLFFDRRPSWMSTFVRRAIGSDPRFVVSSRTATSRGAGTTVGAPPASLTPAGLDAFDVIVVGAPESLTTDDAAALEEFMRTTGGTVCLLMDTTSDSPAIDRLTGVTRWTSSNRAEPSGAPLASEVRMPAELPKWAAPLPGTAATGAGAPAIWQTSIGRGRLIVSGALDAWRYRDRDHAAFDRIWRSLAADAATRPAGPAATVAPIRSPTPDEQLLLRAWTSSHGGLAVHDVEIATLTKAVAARISAPDEAVVWHPMRSVWWIVPFTGCLGFEWWHRRRSGLR
jgi:hypothetical protein